MMTTGISFSKQTIMSCAIDLATLQQNWAGSGILRVEAIMTRVQANARCLLKTHGNAWTMCVKHP